MSEASRDDQRKATSGGGETGCKQDCLRSGKTMCTTVLNRYILDLNDYGYARDVCMHACDVCMNAFVE